LENKITFTVAKNEDVGMSFQEPPFNTLV
jgi:hypothetical protein